MNQVTYPDGSREMISYNDRNYPVRIVNRDGSESLYAYDDRNNLVSVQDERGNTCAYTYDEADNLITYTDKEGHLWSYSYDADHHWSRPKIRKVIVTGTAMTQSAGWYLIHRRPVKR